MERVGVRQLRQNLRVYLRRVKAGQPLEVTERGTPVARLVPIVDEHDPVARLERQGRIVLPATSRRSVRSSSTSSGRSARCSTRCARIPSDLPRRLRPREAGRRGGRVEVRRLAAVVGTPLLGTLDAIHLATALSLREDLDGLVAYDARLARAGAEAGLSVLAPS